MSSTRTRRHARIRLARQRPGPDSVHTRRRRTEPTTSTSAWRRVDWARGATVVGVVAGIGTLLFTGIATYYGAMVSRDQLAQSREDAEKRDRAQAARITTWVDYGEDGGIRLHLMNRSPDPVSYVDMYFDAKVGDWNHTKLAVSYSLSLPSVPPCSDLALDPDDWMYRIPEGRATFPDSHRVPLRREDGWRPQPTPDSIEVYYLTFADREGTTWQRDHGDLEPWEPRDELPVEEADLSGIGGMKRAPRAVPVSTCGDDKAG
ncbi:hypothetical protein ACIQ6Y_33460 [Streptomyces sp. NPDC096205]|uniref:hypothetical protein n=1 Tax=Streptomyces sp. NPDC096205 TaxID=3366081 RepID=UPI0037FDE04D